MQQDFKWFASLLREFPPGEPAQITGIPGERLRQPESLTSKELTKAIGALMAAKTTKRSRVPSPKSLKNLRPPFQPGAAPGPGRPSKRLLERRLGKEFVRHYKTIAAELRELAASGDGEARAILREFSTAGKPIHETENPKAEPIAEGGIRSESQVDNSRDFEADSAAVPGPAPPREKARRRVHRPGDWRSRMEEM